MNAVDMRGGEEIRELYRELILDHARHPRHFGRPEGATHEAEGINPVCGDRLRLYLRLGDNARIDDAGFEGTGCAISIASASLMTDTVIGLPASIALAYFSAVTNRLGGDGPGDDPSGLEFDKLRSLDGVREYPSRVKCATLAWHALNSAIHQHTKPATTE